MGYWFDTVVYDWEVDDLAALLDWIGAPSMPNLEENKLMWVHEPKGCFSVKSWYSAHLLASPHYLTSFALPWVTLEVLSGSKNASYGQLFYPACLP